LVIPGPLKVPPAVPTASVTGASFAHNETGVILALQQFVVTKVRVASSWPLHPPGLVTITRYVVVADGVAFSTAAVPVGAGIAVPFPNNDGPVYH
jgi:hypothetical protein